MHRKLVLLCTVTVLGAAALGCGQTSSSSDSQGRLKAALAIVDEIGRHNALIRCAVNAAEAGDGRTVVKAISHVQDETARNNLGVTCSQRLAEVGNSQMATKVAGRIEDTTMRDNALAIVARGTKE